MKPIASKLASGAPSSSATSVKYELLSFRSAQPQQPIRFEFGPLKESFTLDLPVDPEDGTTREQNWREWKRRIVEHPVVKSAFKATSVLQYSEFALRLPGGGSGEWIGPDSLRDDEEADTKLLQRVAGANTLTSILVLYAPRIHICTFDGIRLSACSFGHWLIAADSKTLERLKRSPGDDNLCPNDWLLRESHQSDLARLLYRVALFLQEELKLESDAYVISVPFGQYIFADGDALGRDEVRARIQFTDIRIFWTLLVKFEDKLLDDGERGKRLEYFVHQRQAWFDARAADYRRWAAQEAALVRAALEAPTIPSNAPFKLPKNCSWDDYGRMQLCLKMLSPLSDMAGQMGAISPKLKTVVATVQTTGNLTGASSPGAPVSINVSTRSDQCVVLVPADRYMNVLTRASADPKTWGAALLEALRDAPDRLYSGLLYETSGLYPCSKDDLAKIDDCLKSLAPKLPGLAKGLAKVVDTSVLPMAADVIKSLETKNHTDKRLFQERAQEAKAYGNVVLSVLGTAMGGGGGGSSGGNLGHGSAAGNASSQPSVWEKKRAVAAPPLMHAPPMRENAFFQMNPREGAEDFLRFDGDSPAGNAAAGTTTTSASGGAGRGGGDDPTPAQAVAGSRFAPPTVRGRATPLDRPPPPTVLAAKDRPPQVRVLSSASTGGPPRILVEGGGAPMSEGPPTVLGRAPPPQVRAIAVNNSNTPPSVIARPQSQSVQQQQPARPDSTPVYQQFSQPPPQRKERDYSMLDREDRVFESMNGGSSGGNRGRGGFRGRGRGSARGGFVSRGGRGDFSDFGGQDAPQMQQQ